MLKIQIGQIALVAQHILGFVIGLYNYILVNKDILHMTKSQYSLAHVVNIAKNQPSLT